MTAPWASSIQPKPLFGAALTLAMLAIASLSYANEATQLNPDDTSLPAAQNRSGEDLAKDRPEKKYAAFCDSIIVVARERRYYLLDQKLKSLSDEIDAKATQIDAKTAELRAWVKRREDFANAANAKLVEIYTGMKAEASAARLASVDRELAAALMLAIPPRQAGVILNEMDEKVAAEITSIMAASAKRTDPT